MEKHNFFSIRKVCLIVISVFFTSIAQGQDKNEQTEILKLCIDLPEIQTEDDLNKNTIVIMQHAVWFNPEDIQSAFTQELIFKEKEEIYAESIPSFFRFEEMDISKSTGSVIYEYHSKQNSKQDRTVTFVSLELKKVNDLWLISETNITRR